MTIIRVTPEILVLTSQRMAQVNGDIRAAVADLSSVLNGLGGEYDGQLRNQVASKVGQAQGAASGPTNQVNALTLELNKRAQLFAAADGQMYAAIKDQSAQLRQAVSADINIWAQWQQIPRGLLDKYLQMGTLIGSGEKNWLLQVLGMSVIALILREGAKPTYAEEPTFRMQPETLNVLIGGLQTDRIGWRVPLTGPDAEHGTGWYIRLGNDEKSLSDCTWFAAAAVKEASGDQIDFLSVEGSKKFGITRSWGHGGQWADSADDYWKNHHEDPNCILTGPTDATPRAGDVAVFSYGHVAYVENAYLSSDGKNWIIQLTEENYYRNNLEVLPGTIACQPPVIVDGHPELLRWRRLISIPKDDPNVRFIHFKYPEPVAVPLDLNPPKMDAPSAQLKNWF